MRAASADKGAGNSAGTFGRYDLNAMASSALCNVSRIGTSQTMRRRGKVLSGEDMSGR